MIRFLPIVIVLLAAAPLSATEHAGTVRAADQFIPGATVSARQGGAKLVTYTDESGRYIFDLTPGVWDIEVTMFGFTPQHAAITVTDRSSNRDWTLEMPRDGEPAVKPAATPADAKKPDTPAPPTTTAGAAPAASRQAAQTGRGGRTGQSQGRGTSAQGRGASAPGRGQQGPAFQNADVTAMDTGQQALANAGDAIPDMASGDAADAFVVNGTTSGGLGVAADDQARFNQMMGGRGGRGGPGGAGGDQGLMSLGASLGGGADPFGIAGFGAAGANGGFGADAGGGGFGLAGPGGGGRGGAGGIGVGGAGGGGGGRGGGGGGGERGGGRGAAGGRGGRGPFNGQFASIGNRRGRGQQQSPYSGSIAATVTNSALNAAPFSINGQSQTKPSSAAETITGNLGGPLRIPKLYNVPNPRWQFYVNFSTSHSRSGSSNVGSLPTTALRNGDFSGITVQNQPVTIYDPLSGSPFPGNMIPRTRFNPVSEALLQYFPQPIYGGLVQNYALDPSNPSERNSFAVRLSGAINNKDRLNINQQFSFNNSSSEQLFGYKDASSGYGMSSTVGWTHSFKPRFNNSASLAFSRNISKGTPYFAYKTDVAGQLGIVGPDQTPIDWGPPSVGFTNFSALSDGTPTLSRSQTTNFTDTVTYVAHRNHNLSFGLGYRRMQSNSLSYAGSRGSFNFDGALTSGYSSTGAVLPNTGYDFADFLLGYPQTTSLRVNDSNLYFRGWAGSVYAQDDWRLNRGLTLNLGLRWEYFSPYTELHGHMATLDINPNGTLVCPVGAAAASNAATASGCPASSVLVGPFTGAYPTSLVNGDPNNFSPRIGFAWRPSQKHSRVIRGGYSIFFSGSSYPQMATRLAGQPQFSTTASLSNSVANVTAGDPLTLQCGFIVTPACPNTPVEPLGTVTNNYAIDKNYKIAYAQTWTIALQQTLPHSILMELEYVGTKGTGLDIVENPNQLPPGSPTSLKGTVTNSPGFVFETDHGNSIFHAGQVRMTRRFTRGMSAVVLYTFSKSIDDSSTFTGGGSGTMVQYLNNLSLERALSSGNQKHRLATTYMLSSPVGVHGLWRNGGWKTKAFTGWTLGGTFAANSGSPSTALLGGSLGSSKSGGIRANYRAEATGDNISGGNYPFFNEAAFTTPDSGTYGDAGRNTIPGLPSFSLTAALNRGWRFGESRKQLQLRLSANNVLNHVQITGFGTTIGSSTFGLATNASQTRTVTLNLRFSF